ncbi:MAG: MFS transporter [Bacteroidota bacterium]
MSLSKIFIKWFDLKPEEGLKFTLLFFHSFFLGLFIAFYFVPANSVFIKNYGSEQLPLAYVIAGIAGYLTSTIYSSLQKRINNKNLFLGAVIFMFAITLVSRFSLTYVDPKYLSFFVFIWVWPFISLVGIVSGGLALQFLNLSQVKRMYGLMNMGGVIASIIGYLSIRVLLPYLGNSYDLLHIGNIGLIAAVFILLALYKTLKISSQKEVVKQVSQSDTKFFVLIKDKYFRLIFLSAIFSMVAIYVVDFGFLSSIKVNFKTEAEISKFLALALGGLKIGELAISYFSSRILSKYGVKLGLTILPVTITLIVAISLIIGLTYGVATIAFLALMTLNKSMERILRRGLDDPAFNILYQPLPSGQKMAVQTKVGVVMQVSIAVAGLILFLTNFILNTPDGYRLEYYPIIILPLLIVWVLVARQLYLSYKGRLRQILIDISRNKKRDSARHFYGSEFLTKKFKKFNDKVVQMSVNLLSETNPRVMEPYATSLLNKRIDSIKHAILSKIDPSWRTRIMHSVKKIYIADKSEEIRDLAFKAKNILDYTNLKEINKGEVNELIKSWTFGDKLLIEKLLVKGLIEYDDKLINRLLKDDDKIIKSAAINLASKSKSPKLIKKLVDLIRSDEYYHICGDALLEVGDRVLDELEEFFIKEEDSKVLLRIIEILAKNGSSKAKSILVRYLNYPDRNVQTELISGLYFCKYQADGKEQSIIKKKLDGVIDNILWIYACILDIETERNTLKIVQALDLEREYNFENLFKLLSFLYEPRIINLIKKNIIGKNTIFAIEIIDNFISLETKQLLIPLFDDISSGQKIKKLNSFFPQDRLKFRDRLKNIIIKDFDKVGPWTMTKSIDLLGRLHAKKKSGAEQEDKTRSYSDIGIWTSEQVNKTLYKIRRSEMPDEIFVCLFHPDELVYSTAAKIIYEENPIKCADYLERMSDDKKELLENLSNNGFLIADRIKHLKKHPMFFSVPENYLAKMAKFIRVKIIQAGEEIDITNDDNTNSVVILLRGELEAVNPNNEPVVFGKNDIITLGINLNANVTKLKGKVKTTLLLAKRFDYYNLLVDQTEIMQHIFGEVAVDE